jgi:hypothetical protein
MKRKMSDSVISISIEKPNEENNHKNAFKNAWNELDSQLEHKTLKKHSRLHNVGDIVSDSAKTHKKDSGLLAIRKKVCGRI